MSKLTLAALVAVLLAVGIPTTEAKAVPFGGLDGLGIAVGTVTATPAGSAATMTPTPTVTSVPATSTPQSTIFLIDNVSGCAISPPAHESRDAAWWLIAAPAFVLVVGRRRNRRDAHESDKGVPRRGRENGRKEPPRQSGA